MDKLIAHSYIFSTIVFTVYSQLVMRWQVAKAGVLPAHFMGKIHFIGHLFLNPWVITGIFATFFAGVSWMMTMTRFEISYAYPWVSLNFVLMLVFGVVLFHETFSSVKLLGTLLIILGIIIIARS